MNNAYICLHISIWIGASSVGANFVLTPYGLIRYGGYTSFSRSLQGNEYDSSVYLLDVMTLRWAEMRLSGLGGDGNGNGVYPSQRYLGAMTFISKNQIIFQNPNAFKFKSESYRVQYDTPSNSRNVNNAGNVMDSVFLFGGANGAVGSTYDGSSGGILSDIWMLRLSHYTTTNSTAVVQKFLQDSCATRLLSNSNSIRNISNTCLGEKGALCSVRDILILAWCSSNNQTTS